MLGHRPLLAAALVALISATSLFARGQTWNFLGCTKIDGNRDHGSIEITRRDRLFRTVQFRLTGDAIFIDHFLIHFGDGTSQELVVGGRLSPEGREYLVEFPDDRRALESVEFWYFKEHWDHHPSVSLYGGRLPDAAKESSGGEP